MVQKRKKRRTKREGKTHCFSCRYFTNNVNRKKVTMINEEIREKLKCFNFKYKKLKIVKNLIKKQLKNKSILIKHVGIFLKVQKRYKKVWLKTVKNKKLQNCYTKMSCVW